MRHNANWEARLKAAQLKAAISAATVQNSAGPGSLVATMNSLENGDDGRAAFYFRLAHHVNQASWDAAEVVRINNEIAFRLKEEQ